MNKYLQYEHMGEVFTHVYSEAKKKELLASFGEVFELTETEYMNEMMDRTIGKVEIQTPEGKHIKFIEETSINAMIKLGYADTEGFGLTEAEELLDQTIPVFYYEVK